MLNIELRIGPLIIVLFLLFNEISSSIQPRWSCYHHLLAGYQKSGIFPLAGHHSNIFSNIKCNFNENSASSEIHSALEVAHHLMNKRSVNYQISDIFYLRELVRRSHCQQTVSVNWKNVPEDGRGGLTFISLLNTSHRVEYNGDERQDFLLTGRFAGVRHLIPDEENYESNPFISATRLLCEHSLQPDCQFNGQIEIDLEANLEWSYSFAFKTDTTNQTLLTLRSGTTSSVVKIENDYFIRVDSSKPISICQLSDASWHTVTVKHNQPDQHFLQIDDYQEIELSKGLITDDTTTTLSVSVNGNIQLIDPTDTNDDCLVSLAKHRRRLQETVITRSLCNGCECSILTDKFDGLNRCADNENDDYDNSYSLRRDNDRLSMFYSKNSFDIDANGAVIPAISVTFKTDSDSGLVFFGFWQNSRAKGRLQVHFHYDTISTIYCQHRDEEKCLGCSIRNVKGFGRDEWIQTVLWGGGDEIHFVVDKSICRLESAANFSLAEIYAIPQFTSHESGLFIGGTWHEKKRHGLYKNEIEHQFFENTREKAPVLRGCIKNLFLKSQKADLSNIFEEQKELFLINPSDSDGFAVKFGCPKCRPKCSEDARCRSYRPIEASPQICDCADILQFNTSNGNCEKRIEKPIVLSTEFLSQSEIVIDIPNSKAVLNKIWIQFSLPKQIIQDQTIIEFNSHREKLFNIRVDVDGFVHIQCHGQDDDRNAARKLSLIDDRIHMIQLERRTPIGTKHTAKKFDLYIDGWHTIISDIGKMILNNITIFASDSTDEYNSIIIYGFGLGYDYDEHFALLNPSNALHQIDIHSELIPYQFRNPILSKTAILDPFLWEKNQDSIESSQYGQIVDYTADVIEPEQLLSARWIMYSLFLTILLCLFISICIICYWCILRRKSLRREESGSQRTIMRDSPDYGPVKLRPNSLSAISSNDEDGSIGTDDTDLQAYRDIPSHRVKIYRESMVSILVPSIDLPAEAAIVKRSKSSASDQFATNSVAPNESHAPLVKVNDD